MTQKQEFLTQSEAIAQGYSLCGIKDREFQHLSNIAELNQVDFEDNDYLVADKEPTHLGIDGESICDMVIDSVMDSSDFDDDTDSIPDAIKGALDWDEFAEKINTALQKRPYYYLTKINLLPSP
jgi:hypothetical protein